MSIFRKKNNIYIVNKDPMETFDHFIERGNFIAAQNPISEHEYENVVLYSHIYINSKYLKCNYKDDIMQNLENMIKKCKIA